MKRTQNRPEVTEKRLMSNSQEGKYLAKKDLSDLAYLRSYLAIINAWENTSPTNKNDESHCHTRQRQVPNDYH